MHPGIPAYRHDWQWPPYPELLRSFAESKLYAWSWSDLGTANISLQVHPYYALIALSSLALSSKAVLCLVIGLCTFAAAYGAARLSQIYGSEGRACPEIAAILFALSPFIINELVAGHLEVIAAAAALPWVLYTASRDNRLCNLGFALALGWTTLHLQYLIFAVALVVIVYGLRPFFRHYIICPALAAILLPQLWALRRPEANSATHSMMTSVPWLAAQSQSMTTALTGAHYFAHYWEAATASVGFLQLSPWLYPAGIAGILFLGIPRSRAIAVAFLAAVFVLSAEDGPLSILFRAATKFSVATLFREPYHVAAVIELLGAVALSAVFCRLPKVARVVGGAGCLVLFASPFLMLRVFSQTASVYPGIAIEKVLLRESRIGTPARMFMPPGFSPVGLQGAEIGGADPLAFSLGDMVPLWSYRPSGEMPSVIWEFTQTRPRRALFKELGVASILVRPGLQSKLSSVIPYHGAPTPPLFVGAYKKIPGYQSNGRHRPYGLPDSPSLLRLQRSRPLAASGLTRPPFALVEGDNPGANWAPGEDWWFLNAMLARNSQAAAVTWSQSAVLNCAGSIRRARVTFVTFDKTSNRQIAKSAPFALDCVHGTRVPGRMPADKLRRRFTIEPCWSGAGH